MMKAELIDARRGGAVSATRMHEYNIRGVVGRGGGGGGQRSGNGRRRRRH